MANLQRTWFVHLQGENFGPLSTEVVVLMIQQKRLEYWDFIWTQGLDSWARIADMMPFSEMLPAYPDAPIPGDPGTGTIVNPTQSGKYIAPPGIPPLQTTTPTPYPPPKEEEVKSNSEKKKSTRGLRRHGRAQIHGTIAIDGHETYELYDIGEGGLFVIASPAVATGTDVKFKLSSRSLSKTLSMTGIVIREGKAENGKPGFVIQFTRVNPAHSRMIRDYVQNHQDK